MDWADTARIRPGPSVCSVDGQILAGLGGGGARVPASREQIHKERPRGRERRAQPSGLAQVLHGFRPSSSLDEPARKVEVALRECRRESEGAAEVMLRRWLIARRRRQDAEVDL